MKLLVALLILLVTIGCSTVDLASDTDQRAAQAFQPPPGKANIYVVRNDFGHMTLFPVILDGRDHGMLATDTYFVISVEPGHHVVVSRTTESQQSVEFEVEAGRNYFVSVKSRPGLQAMRPQVSQLSEPEGRQAIMEARLAKKLGRPAE
jgi:Protein of unknown function (DUF2846)